MSVNIEDYMDVNRPSGEIVDTDMVKSLMQSGRIHFDFKDTVTSATSTSGETPDDPDDRGIDNYIDSVRENEELVKTLEDMRDQMLAGMNIPPANEDISNAAKVLGSPNGNITKDVLDKAKVITDPDIFVPNQLGIAPDIGALVGDSVIDGDFKDCTEMTKAVTDGWKITKGFVPDNQQEKFANNSITAAKTAHKKKLDQLWKFIFNMLWWEQLWSRIVIFNLSMLEKIMAKPIDIWALIFRWKRPTQTNYYKYGPVHRLINKLRIYLLCSVPTNAWKEYTPDPEIQIYDRKSDSMVGLPNFCAGKSVSECPDANDDPNQVENDSNRPFDSTEDQEEYMKKMTEDQEDNRTCVDMDILKHPFIKPSKKGIGFSPKCAEAAKTILDAVYDDALNQGATVLDDNSVDDIGSILTGNVKEGINAN